MKFDPLQPTFKGAKAELRAFMQAHYSDERLAALLAHAQDGKLSYNSCDCFVGIVTAKHALHAGLMRHEDYLPECGIHLHAARILDRGYHAEAAFLFLGQCINGNLIGDELRSRILIPMIRAEQRRRERLRVQEVSVVEQEYAQATA